MSDSVYKAIIMDDDIDYANFLFDVTKSLGIESTITTHPEKFMELFDSSVSLVFLDLNIPDINGLDLLRFIENKQATCDIILMSGVEERILEAADAFAKSINLPIVGFFQKTIRLAELENLLKKISMPGKIEVELPHEIPKFTKAITKEAIIQAMQHHEFVMFYQPKIDIVTGCFYGVECLVRWLNQDQSLTYPDQFIHQVESFGLMEDLTWMVMHKAIQEIDTLQNIVSYPFKLSLNVSPSMLKDLEFPNKFLNLLQQSTLQPSAIILEITEAGFIQELSSALEIFTRLRLNDIQLSIDDFGTGYAMMQQLKIIPANEIKIDKSFVQTMLTEKSAEVTVKKIIEIGHELGMKVVAEGVETEEQYQFLKANQCDIVQGYLFSKPIPLADLETWISKTLAISKSLHLVSKLPHNFDNFLNPGQ